MVSAAQRSATSGTLPLYTLYRRRRVVVPSTVLTTATGQLDLNYQSINTTTGAIGNGGTPPMSAKPDYLRSQHQRFLAGLRCISTVRAGPDDPCKRRFGMNTSTQLPGLPLRSDGTYRYPAYALGPLSNTLPVQSPNYQPDDEDCTAALDDSALSAVLQGRHRHHPDGRDFLRRDPDLQRRPHQREHGLLRRRTSSSRRV